MYLLLKMSTFFAPEFLGSESTGYRSKDIAPEEDRPIILTQICEASRETRRLSNKRWFSPVILLMVQKSGEPVEVDSLTILLREFYTSQVVQDFFHQQ